MKKIYILIMLSLTGLSSVFSQIPSNGLLAWYQFDANALDSSGNNNNGVLNGPNSTANRFGIPNKALLFNGNGQYVSIGNDIWSNNLTLSAWVYVSDFGSTSSSNAGKMIFFKAPGMGYSQDYNLMVYYDVNSQPRAQFYFGQSSTQNLALVSSSVLQTNQWYLLTATRENGVAKLYINANLDATANYSFTPVNQNFNLKLGMSHLNSQSFNGKLDEMRIYNRALTAPEIITIYNEQPPVGLLAWYPCDNSGIDIGGYNYNGNLYGPTSTTDRNNIPNNALMFNGNGQYIDVPYNIWSNSISLSAWIYVNDFGSTSSSNAGRMIFFKAPNMGYSQDYNLMVYYDVNSQPRAQFYFGQSSTQNLALISNTVLEVNQWYLLTATRENGVAKLYINENLDATANYSFTPVNQNYNLKLGMSHLSTQSFSGRLDELKIYNYALSASQISGFFTTINENKNKNTESTIKIYPNPAKDNLSIELQKDKTLQNTIISIYNIQGQLIKQLAITQHQTEIDIHSFAAGVYIVKVNNDKETLQGKFVKD